MHTYGGQATRKAGVKPSLHVQAYTGDMPPALLPGESLTEKPLKIELDDNSVEPLKPETRIHFGRTYSVDHNIPFWSIGRVEVNDFERLKFLIRGATNPY
jgi:hypothetical protein